MKLQFLKLLTVCLLMTLSAHGQEGGMEEKLLYKTDFSEWTEAKAAKTESTVEWTTKYTEEKLDFTLYNTAILLTEDSKFASYTELPHKCLRAEKAADPYVVTSKLASITRVRFIHGATGGSRGWKLEAKGDGDEDWVVISDSYASPSSWCEVEKEVGRSNVQLRFTNLNASQNAYLFELDIYGLADMSHSPLLGTFRANGVEYVAGDIFEQDNSGNYVATIELSKQAQMISEANPLTDITADNGQIGTITYQGTDTQCVVTIPVTANGQTVNYVATFVQKPDFTLSYISPEDGVTVLATQQVEKDSPIGHFQGDAASNYAIPAGYAMRGWFAKPSGGRKFTVDDIVTGNLNLYGRCTEIEQPSNTKKYVFNLADQYFYAEDHEAFCPTGTGKFHDTTHGWVFSSGDKIDLLVGPKATISFAVCKYSKADAKILIGGTELAAYSDSDGDVVAYNYEGQGGTLQATIEGSGSVYLHSVTIVNTSELNYDRQGDWYFVKAGNVESLVSVIDAVNATNAKPDATRAFVYIPNGLYDFKQTCLTTLSADNVSLIGQSQQGVIIRNAPDKEDEGINKTATLVITGQNSYLQDLTIQNALDYYNSGSAGRGVCLWDKGNRTICKNVRLLSYQDTYYTNNNSAQLYWETSDIHGTVDFICGGGDVRFVNSTLSLEPRNADGKGGRTITAPTTTTQYGYVFDGCTVVDLAKGKGDWNFGRTWQNEPVCVYLNTTLDDLAAKTLISKRWTEKGMNSKDPKLFGEWGTKDSKGNGIMPSSNVINSHGGNFETILTEDQAAAFAYDKMFADWHPAGYTVQAEAPKDAKYDNGTVTWSHSTADFCYFAVFKNGQLVGITNQSSLAVDINPASDGLTIRRANLMGGLGPEAPVAGTANGIEAVSGPKAKEQLYNIKGQPVGSPSKGIYIAGGKKIIL